MVSSFLFVVGLCRQMYPQKDQNTVNRTYLMRYPLHHDPQQLETLTLFTSVHANFRKSVFRYQIFLVELYFEAFSN